MRFKRYIAYIHQGNLIRLRKIYCSFVINKFHICISLIAPILSAKETSYLFCKN